MIFVPFLCSAQDVYICTSRGAKSYHKTERCANANCSKSVKQVTIAEAERMHRKPCQRCMRGSVFPSFFINKTDDTPSCDLTCIEIARTSKGRRSQVVKHLGYTASYNSFWLISNWVAYELTPQKAVGEVKRPSIPCKPDPLVTSTSAEHADYTKSGFCRGHLSPAMDMKWSETAMNESFYMSNICPQTEGLNNGMWRRIEEHLHAMAVRGSTLYICSGPIMPKHPQRFGKNRVAAPTYCYKVVCMKKNGHWYSIGFILPNTDCAGSMLDYAMSVDEIESKTGIDFFFNLPDDVEDEMESKVIRKIWGL